MTVDEIDKKIQQLELEKEKLTNSPRFKGWEVYGQNNNRVLEINAEIEDLRKDRAEALGKGLRRALIF